VRRRDLLGSERAGDRAEASATCVLQTDPLDDARRKRRRPTGTASALSVATARWREVVAEEALELVDGNEPLTQGSLTVSMEGTTRSMVEILTPSASAAWRRV
jgi:hypothetical protein